MRNRLGCIASAVGLSLASLAGPGTAMAQGLGSSDAGHTSLVLVPGVGMDAGNTGKGMNLFIGLGGHVEWLPQVPVLVTAGAYKEIAGKSGWTGFEVSGGYRFRESVGHGYEGVVSNVRRLSRDTVEETFSYGETAVRHYSVLRAGLLHNTSVAQAPGVPDVTTSSFYVGLSRNALVSQQGGIMGHHLIRTTSVDLLFGSPDATAPKHNKIGGRASFNVDWGNNFDTRFELGLRPGLGAYVQLSINGYFMFTDVLR